MEKIVKIGISIIIITIMMMIPLITIPFYMNIYLDFTFNALTLYPFTLLIFCILFYITQYIEKKKYVVMIKCLTFLSFIPLFFMIDHASLYILLASIPMAIVLLSFEKFIKVDQKVKTSITSFILYLIITFTIYFGFLSIFNE